MTIEGRQLGKGANIEEAREMLRSLAGKVHTVTSSAVVVCRAENYEFAAADETWVYFKPYDEKTVEAYLATNDWRDKAGAYGIQSGAGSLVDHTEGDIETIIGLPTRLLIEPFARFGYHVKPSGYRL